MLLSLALLLLAGPARAQDEDLPLAIPANPDAPPPAVQAPEPEVVGPQAPTRGAPMTPEKLEALRRYQAERLSIRGETEVYGGGARAVWVGGWWGPRWGPHTTVAVVPEPVFATRTWGIYQGPQRIDVPDAMRMSGDTQAEALEGTIRSKKSAARAWYTVAGVGGAVAVASLFGQLSADNRYEYANWQIAGLGGATAGVVGLLGAAGPAGEARALERYPARSLTPAEARNLVDRHNDRLRQELGLSPQEVWSIEREEPPGPPGY